MLAGIATTIEYNSMVITENTVVAVVGLGYVGLPLAVEFGKKYRLLGYDPSEAKIKSCQNHCDLMGEVRSEDLRASTKLSVSTDPGFIGEADVIIVAVPTPVDGARVPDLSSLVNSSITVGKHLKKGAIVVYESTVFPGATEDVCIPLLEKHSGMKWKQGFHVGYSPERINPGDKEHSITKIVKVVSGDDEATLNAVCDLYQSIIIAGVHRASSIKVAEAAKVIENTQRDLNIALMNEVAIIFEKLGIDTHEVLQAAGTKWNFLPFYPGLVGGHCIGVDPYYLTHKAETLGYHPQVILSGRRINDSMASYIVQQTVKKMISAGISIKDAKVIIMGLTFKENCPDLRNSKVGDIVNELREYGCEISVHDPIAEPYAAKREYGITLMPWDHLPRAEAIVAAVPHKEYLSMPLTDITCLLKPGGVFVDIKSSYDKTAFKNGGFSVWRL